MVWQNVVNALLGIWFIVAPFSLSFTGNTAEMLTSIVGGVIVLVLAGSAALNEEARHQVWVQYVDGLVGIWFIIAPWALSFVGESREFWTSLIPGAVVLILSAWLLALMPRTAPTPQPR
jgi:hypothetical protein